MKDFSFCISDNNDNKKKRKEKAMRGCVLSSDITAITLGYQKIQ